ncbi:MAG: glutathione S-transferase [Halieaceae bacterium]|jgi:glutathione S-transferase
MTATDLQPIRLFGSSISYFTGKLEHYFRSRGIDYELLPITGGRVSKLIKQKVGTAQMPALELGDGRWMTDSTVIIQWFEEHYPQGGLIPGDPLLRFFSFLLEDYADEWLWRPAMHYRWYYPLGANFAGYHLAAELGVETPLPLFLKRWIIVQRQRRGFTSGDGITRDQVGGVEAIYHRTLQQMQGILNTRPFLLGDRPSLVDIGFAGPMFRHFGLDPVPAEIMRQQAPAVLEWLGRLWNSGPLVYASGGDVSAGDTREANVLLLEGCMPMLKEVGKAYLPYLNANVHAIECGERRFDTDIDGVQYRAARSSNYRVWCLKVLRERFAQLEEGAQAAARSILERSGCWEPLWELAELPVNDSLCARLPFYADAKMIDVYD